jgi:diguanylate cyclase (GGDEF)-like protein
MATPGSACSNALQPRRANRTLRFLVEFLQSLRSPTVALRITALLLVSALGVIALYYLGILFVIIEILKGVRAIIDISSKFARWWRWHNFEEDTDREQQLVSPQGINDCPADANDDDWPTDANDDDWSIDACDLSGCPKLSCDSLPLPLVTRDKVTGLADRTFFLRQLGEMLAWAKCDGRPPPSVMVIRLDKFYNIELHANFIVWTIVQRLKQLIDPQDTLARLSNDEFGLILSGASDAAVVALAEAIRATIRAPVTIMDRELFAVGSKDVRLTGSIGIRFCDGEPQRGIKMLNDASVAMYCAESRGGDRVATFRPGMDAHLKQDSRYSFRLFMFEWEDRGPIFEIA